MTKIQTNDQLNSAIENGEVLVFEGENIPANVATTLAAYEGQFLPGRVYFLKAETKYAVQLKCCDCGSTERIVRTSDLHQVKRCQTCTAKARKERMKAKRIEAREALAALASQPAAPKKATSKKPTAKKD